MSFPRKHLYPKPLQAAAFAGRAFCHPERIHIVLLLAQYKELNVYEITKLSPLTRPTVSQHLTLLREHQLIEWREEYPFVYYSLDRRVLESTIAQYIVPFQDLIETDNRIASGGE